MYFVFWQRGDTALHLAVRKDNAMVIKALLCSGSDLTIRNKVRTLPLQPKQLLRRFINRQDDLGGEC